jgi:alanyl-tRNA synthetase
MGGQVGDTGELAHGGQLWRIANTQRAGNTFLHILEDADTPLAGMELQLMVDAQRRAAIQRHHTVSHLLHWALHEVVGREATQKGSSVAPDKMTFDFNAAALTPAQTRDVEKLVNERIVENGSVSWSEVPFAEIKNHPGIMQLFGEKYGDHVRVIQIGGQPGALNGYSMELCGGTHTRSTGEIGLFRIVSEGAIAAGTRRIEGLAGLCAYEKSRKEADLLISIAGIASTPVGELEKKMESLLATQKELEKQIKAAHLKQAAETARSLAAAAETIGNYRIIVQNLGEIDTDLPQMLIDTLKGQFKGIVVLGGTVAGSVQLAASVSSDYVKQFQAGKIIQTIAPIVGGKGGGKPDYARGGGKDPARLDEALVKAKTLIAG